MIDIFSILPLLMLLVWALLLLLAGLFLPKRLEKLPPFLAALGLIVTFVFLMVVAVEPLSGFGGMVLTDKFAVFLDSLFLLGGLLAILISPAYLQRVNINNYEYYPLLLLSVSGMMLMASAADLILVFLALELLSIPLYILAGLARPRLESEEGALKYFLLGSFASGFVLFGTAFLFGATATTSISGIAAAVTGGTANLTFLVAGGALLLVGVGFKVAVVPFHGWAPDVYQGAPSSVTAFMAFGAKAAGFAALLRVFSLAFPSAQNVFMPVFAALAALTMLVGNVLTVVQSNLKRMLAYAGIAGAGYVLMAFVPFGNLAVQADSVASALFYLMSFALASYGAWAVLVSLETADGKGLELDDLAGLGKKSPLLAGALTIFMLSFTGIPLTLGFWGKFYLFRSVIEGGFVWLAVIGLLTSLIGAYFALRVILTLYFKEGQPTVFRSYWTTFVVIFSALCVVVLSFIPAELFDLAGKALISLAK
jgi:NADH-quinone oxidoreductase subunit N